MRKLGDDIQSEVVEEHKTLVEVDGMADGVDCRDLETVDGVAVQEVVVDACALAVAWGCKVSAPAEGADVPGLTVQVAQFWVVVGLGFELELEPELKLEFVSEVDLGWAL